MHRKSKPLQRQYDRAGGRAIALIKDSSDEKDVAGAVTTAVKEFGGLDVCYAYAGISGGLVPFFEETSEHWTEVLKINLIGTFLLAKYAAMEMVKHRRGSIICTASVAGLRSGAGGVPYSASKAGVVSLVQTVAYQMTGTGVRINAICPGLIETGMTRPMFERARERGTSGKIGQLNPLQRYGVPQEIAQAALFLASDAASLRKRSGHRGGRRPVGTSPPGRQHAPSIVKSDPLLLLAARRRRRFRSLVGHGCFCLLSGGRLVGTCTG